MAFVRFATANWWKCVHFLLCFYWEFMSDPSSEFPHLFEVFQTTNKDWVVDIEVFSLCIFAFVLSHRCQMYLIVKIRWPTSFFFFYLQNLHRPFWTSWTTLYLDFRRLLPHRKAVWDREMTLWLPTILKVVEPNMMMIFARSSIARSRSICSLYLIVTVVNTVTCSCTVKMSRKKYKHHITGKINILISKWGKN